MPIDIYQHENHKFSDLGLQLRLPVDMVPQGQFSRLTNCEPVIEGQLETRAGVDSLATVYANNPVNSIFRLNQQPNSGIPSERLFGAGVFMWSQILPGGTPQIPTGATFDGNPLSIIDFRFDFDSASWAIIANSAGMRKHRVRQNAGTIITPYLDWVLGEPPPTESASATSGGAGLLNNGTGPGYDWRYTYVNSLLNSESNPSPITLVGGIGQQRPTVNVNPDSNVAPSTTLTVGPKAQPWSFSGGINIAFQYGLNDGTAPVVYSPILTPGDTIRVAYISGTVHCSDSRPHVNAAGQASFVTDGQGGSTGTFFPTKYLPGSPLGLGGLVAAFTDASGNVILPLSVGLGGTFVVPAGASKLQFGIDDDRYVDNTDTGFRITVAGVAAAPCTNPTNAYDDDPTTFATFVATAFPPTSQSCRFSGWPAGGGTVVGVTLNVDSEVLLVGGGGNNDVQTFVEYSTDNGSTWSVLYSIYGIRGRQTDVVTFAVGVDLSQLQLRALTVGNGKAGSTYTMTMRLYEIWTETTAGSADVLALTNEKALVCCGVMHDTQEDMIRLYRRGGSLLDTWYKVGDFLTSTLSIGGCGVGFYEITDNIPDDELGDPIALDNDMPVSGIQNLNTPLPIIWGQFDRRVLGCGDPSRPDAVYFSKQGNADQWPPSNWVTVSTPSDPMQAGCIYNTRCFAFSKERMYELVPGLVSGVTFSPFPTPTTRGLISPYGLCVYDKVYFVAKDGIYATTGGPEQSIVENDIKPLFPTKDMPGRTVHGYEAVDMSQPALIRLSTHNDEVYFTYPGADTGTLQTLVYDIRKPRWRAATYTPPMRCFYSEPGGVSSLLAGGTDGDFYQSIFGTDNGVPIQVSLRTGAHDQGIQLSQKEYGSVVFDIDPGGADATNPIVITPYINGEAFAESSILVMGTGRQQIPLNLNDIFAYNIEFEITWVRRDAGVSSTPIVPFLYQYDILWRPEPTRLTHWEARENSYGLAGYGHLRDGYIGLRSDSDVVMKFYVEGNNTTPITSITFPTTQGARRKLFFAMAGGWKWKVLRVTVDSADGTTPFRIYEPDCEFRAKQWLTPLGYQVIRMVGAESQFASAAWQSQLLGGGSAGGGG
jgi:hypothetical protein